jgi:beta-glucanase (GH16 family)
MRKFQIAGLLVLLFIPLDIILSQTYTFREVWSDHFERSASKPDSVCAVDPEKWDFEDGYVRNNELQYYTRDTANVRERNGNLEIVVRKQNMGGMQYTSGSVITHGRKNIVYGKIEGRFKMSNGKGFWQCFWTLGSNYTEVWWPRCGEIDIFEHINSEGNVHCTAHFANALGLRTSVGGTPPVVDVTKWNTYSIEWTPTTITWFIADSLNENKRQVHQMAIGAVTVNSREEFHLPHYVLINFPIGGTWPGNPDASTPLPSTMYCDYVKFYEYVPVTVPAITYVLVNPATVASLPMNRTLQLKAQIIPYIAANKDLSWQSSNPLVATVNSEGLVRGVGVGTATITATSVADATKKSTSTVTVIDANGHNFIANPGFELDNAEVQKPVGWSEWSPKTPSSVDSAKVVTGNPHSGTYYCRMFGKAPYQAMTFQTVKNMPTGTYTLKGWFRSSGGQPWAAMSIKNHGGNELFAPLTSAMNNWTQLSINNIEITTGTCEVDIYSDAAANQWIEFDDIELTLNPLPAGISDQNSDYISVYPNVVTNNLLNISTSGLNNCKVSITGINGQLRYSDRLNYSKSTINTSFLRQRYVPGSCKQRN